MQEAENILRILKETRKALNDNDFYKIKLLSDQTVHTATVYQDPDNIITAVLVYSLGKIMERENYKQMPDWDEFFKSFLINLDIAIKALEKKDIEKFRESVGKIRNSINKISGHLSEYIRDIFQKAEINKAFKMYEHGLSSERTAEVLGISLWDLSSYIGQSTVSEARLNEGLPIKKRIKFVEDIFAK
ncbi:MAG: hypothetical protein Q7S33_04590 [Nanoarchaeota archaeon]|nr:hypothetical protein [Nanoarchaeota archaeon]